jgi:ABC-type transport system involved in cytochrome bd biosynthesis fused ATPase/permease subunit
METFTPSLDWGDELITSVLWVAKAWVIGGGGHGRCTGAARQVHHLGPSVLAGHWRLFQGSRKHSGVAVAGEFDDAAIGITLDTVALGHLASRLDEVADWAKVLSPGEQQRIAFARVLLAKPRAVFLDESTSALDEGQEFALYRSLRTALPDCVVVSVSHRGTVEQHHDRRLELLGGGQWRLAPIDGPA